MTELKSYLFPFVSLICCCCAKCVFLLPVNMSRLNAPLTHKGFAHSWPLIHQLHNSLGANALSEIIQHFSHREHLHNSLPVGATLKVSFDYHAHTQHTHTHTASVLTHISEHDTRPHVHGGWGVITDMLITELYSCGAQQT